MAIPRTFTFAVYPADYAADNGCTFDAFLLDVPTLLHVGDGAAAEDAAARRAWWTACATLSQQGIEPEDFLVSCWRNNSPGPLVTSGGIVQ